VFANAELRLKDVKSLLGYENEVADLKVGAVCELPVQCGGDPECSESHRNIGRSCVAVLPLDQSTNDP
jgi:hypothetical protein